MKIILAKPRGFCAGVDRAIEVVKRALTLFGSPVYVHHEVVHNRTVVAELKKQGAIFLENLSEIPYGATLIFSAHGVSPRVRHSAQLRSLRIFDATCPLVTKVHMEVARCSRLGHECIFIGHADHPEVVGSLGYYDNSQGGIYLVEKVEDAFSLSVKNPHLLHYVTQTTLSIEDTETIIKALKRRFPLINSSKKEDICYATQNRQRAAKKLAQQCEIVFVIGSKNSSNSRRLKEVVERLGKPAYLIDSGEDIKEEWLKEKKVLGITAGASAPEFLVQAAIRHIKTFTRWEKCSISDMVGSPENVKFVLPRGVREIPILREH